MFFFVIFSDEFFHSAFPTPPREKLREKGKIIDSKFSMLITFSFSLMAMKIQNKRDRISPAKAEVV
jgi:hypothetical protein